MIDQIRGKLIDISLPSIVVEISEGLSISLVTPNATILTLQQQIHLYTHMHWNQENGPSLFGFESKIDRQVFQLIISCSGIGPKMGLTVLQAMSSAHFISAVATDNITALSSIPGIGKKKAETIILHLKDKVSKLVETGIVSVDDSVNIQHIQDVMSTLLSLNYTKQETVYALDTLKKQEDINQLSFDSMLRKSLVVLSKRS